MYRQIGDLFGLELLGDDYGIEIQKSERNDTLRRKEFTGGLTLVSGTVSHKETLLYLLALAALELFPNEG